MDDMPGTGMRVMSAQLSILRNFAVTEARAIECSNRYIEVLIADGAETPDYFWSKEYNAYL